MAMTDEERRQWDRDYSRRRHEQDPVKVNASKLAYYYHNAAKLNGDRRRWDQTHPKQTKARDRLEHEGKKGHYDPEHAHKYYEANRERLRKMGAVYYEANRERVVKTSAAWYAEHREEKLQTARARYAANPERARMNASRWYEANRAKTAERSHAWALANPERVFQAQRKYGKTHPEVSRINAEKRRAAKYANTPIEDMLTSTEWLAILAEANGHCHYCDREAKLTLDHVIPLSKGGKHSKDNVVSACVHCNSSKGNKTLEEWRLIQAKK
jgi:5-methylcytosine-specific restriction endonuclease McrA